MVTRVKDNRSPEFLDLKTAEIHPVSMVLQEDMSLFGQSKVFPLRVFAARYQGMIIGSATLVLQHFPAIEPVLYPVVGVNDDHAPVPLTNRTTGTGFAQGWNEIIERSERTVACYAQLSIRVFGIIQDLVLQPDSRSGVVLFFGNKILHTAIGTVG